MNVVCDVRYLPFKSNIFSLVHASDIIEHFGRHEYMDVLLEWKRVIADGGEILIKTPNLEGILGLLSLQLIDGGEAARRLFANQGDEYDFHKNIFTPRTLTQALRRSGYSGIVVQSKLPSPDETNMAARADVGTPSNQTY